MAKLGIKPRFLESEPSSLPTRPRFPPRCLSCGQATVSNIELQVGIITHLGRESSSRTSDGDWGKWLSVADLSVPHQWTRANYFISLCLSFPFCKTGVLMPSSQICWAGVWLSESESLRFWLSHLRHLKRDWFFIREFLSTFWKTKVLPWCLRASLQNTPGDFSSHNPPLS